MQGGRPRHRPDTWKGRRWDTPNRIAVGGGDPIGLMGGGCFIQLLVDDMQVALSLPLAARVACMFDARVACEGHCAILAKLPACITWLGSPSYLVASL
jgi:hypothetical protein